MKALIREYLYDKLRRSLYKHEVKRLVWNNPYFPFYNQYHCENCIRWATYDENEINKIYDYIERIKSNPHFDKTSRKSYEEFLNKEFDRIHKGYDEPCESWAMSCLTQHFQIWDYIENNYGEH